MEKSFVGAGINDGFESVCLPSVPIAQTYMEHRPPDRSRARSLWIRFLKWNYRVVEAHRRSEDSMRPVFRDLDDERIGFTLFARACGNVLVGRALSDQACLVSRQ